VLLMGSGAKVTPSGSPVQEARFHVEVKGSSLPLVCMPALVPFGWVSRFLKEVTLVNVDMVNAQFVKDQPSLFSLPLEVLQSLLTFGFCFSIA